MASNEFKAAGKAQKASASANTEVPPLLVQLASITPLRLLLQGLRSEPYYHDLSPAPLYTFYSTTPESSKIGVLHVYLGVYSPAQYLQVL